LEYFNEICVVLDTELIRPNTPHKINTSRLVSYEYKICPDELHIYRLKRGNNKKNKNKNKKQNNHASIFSDSDVERTD
jgi:hypothetical protein